MIRGINPHILACEEKATPPQQLTDVGYLWNRLWVVGSQCAVSLQTLMLA